MTYVDSLVDAVTAAAVAHHDVAGPVNVADATPVVPAALLEELFDRLYRPIRIVAVPSPLADGAAAVVELGWRVAPAAREPPLTRYAVAALARPLTLDLTRLHEELGVWPDAALGRRACPDRGLAAGPRPAPSTPPESKRRGRSLVLAADRSPSPVGPWLSAARSIATGVAQAIRSRLRNLAAGSQSCVRRVRAHASISASSESRTSGGAKLCVAARRWSVARSSRSSPAIRTRWRSSSFSVVPKNGGSSLEIVISTPRRQNSVIGCASSDANSPIADVGRRADVEHDVVADQPRRAPPRRGWRRRRGRSGPPPARPAPTRCSTAGPSRRRAPRSRAPAGAPPAGRGRSPRSGRCPRSP